MVLLALVQVGLFSILPKRVWWSAGRTPWVICQSKNYKRTLWESMMHDLEPKGWRRSDPYLNKKRKKS